MTDDKHNVSFAFCPASAQTILEDEVDDPVYQVGPGAHRARNTADLDAFLASLVLFSL